MSKKLGIWVCDMGSIYCRKETKIISKQLYEIVGTHCWYHSIPTLKASVYGKRDGCITGLAITHNSRNQFHGTRGWKTGVVHDVSMLPRSEMFKPDVLGFTFSNIFQHVFFHPQASTPPTSLWPALPEKVSSPSRAHPMPHLGRAFADVQECKQVPGSVCKNLFF